LADHNRNMTLPPEKYVQYVMGQHNQHSQSLTEEMMKCKTGKAVGLNGITNYLMRETTIHFKKYCKYGHPCNMLGTWSHPSREENCNNYKAVCKAGALGPLETYTMIKHLDLLVLKY